MNSETDQLDWTSSVAHLRKQGINISETLLRSRHRYGTGPKYVKPNARTIRFRRGDLDAWVASWTDVVQQSN
jgi:hypothetical protein